MYRFKEGDKVVVTKELIGYRKGTDGIVELVDFKNFLPYYVRVKGCRVGWMGASNIGLNKQYYREERLKHILNKNVVPEPVSLTSDAKNNSHG